MDKARVLVVDDDELMRSLIVNVLAGEHAVRCASSGPEGLALLANEPVDVLVTDLRMPGMDGTAVVRRVRAERPGLPVIVTSGMGTVADFAELLRLGVADFVVKPFRPVEMQFAVMRALELARLRDAAEPPAEGAPEPTPLDDWIGEGGLLGRVKQQLARLAPTEATIVLEGPSGSGKSLAARAVHALSPRRDAPLVVLRAEHAAESLIDGQLFGHAAGAFTGATSDRPGAFERAAGGTLVLDDVGNLGTGTQARLVRALSEGEVRRLGEDRARPVDARIVVLAPEPLAALAARGRLRADLCHLLDVVKIRLPALAEIGQVEHAALVSRLLQRTCARLGRPPHDLDDDAAALLSDHAWPGNVRELENALERAVLLADGETLGASDFAFLATAGPPARRIVLPEQGLDLDATLRAVESDLIDCALERSQGRREAAAKLLGLKRTALVQKIKRREGAHPP